MILGAVIFIYSDDIIIQVFFVLFLADVPSCSGNAEMRNIEKDATFKGTCFHIMNNISKCIPIVYIGDQSSTH